MQNVPAIRSALKIDKFAYRSCIDPVSSTSAVSEYILNIDFNMFK